jgi:hypothetical protein
MHDLVRDLSPGRPTSEQTRCLPLETGGNEVAANEHARLVSGVATVNGRNRSGTPATTPDFRPLLRGRGRALESKLAQSMSASLGHDFSRVRVHDGRLASEIAASLGAEAFTVGTDVGFAAGTYAPERHRGRSLLAHELAHVIQQGNGRTAVALQARGTGAVEQLPEVLVRQQPGTNIWVVTVGLVPVAEIMITTEELQVQIDTNVDPSGIEIVVRHFGNASVATVDPGVSMRLPVSVREIDMRPPQGSDSVTARPSAGSRPDVAGTISLSAVAIRNGLPPWIPPPSEIGPVPVVGLLSDWEEMARKGLRSFEGTIVDPEDPTQVIGYATSLGSVTQIVDREGELQFIHEIGIETPLLDPIDLLPGPRTVGTVGGRILPKLLGKKAASTGVKVPLATVARLRRISAAIARRGGRKAVEEAPVLLGRITQEGLKHSFDRHALEWFGRHVGKETHMHLWRALIERVARSKQVFRWSVGDAATIAHLGRVEGKYFVVQFFEETGELATAFVPSRSQLQRMLQAAQALP